MLANQEPANLGVYRAADVVAYYATQSHLPPCERRLFDTYLRQGGAILDLGVGGGRTTPYLASIASRYVGVDYSEEMVQVCRAKFPELQFEVADASALSRFADASFDSVVFSYNGIDMLAPDEKRKNCLRECYRLLRPGGVFIFSSHNPRSLFLDWQWDQERLRTLAGKVANSETVLFRLTLGLLTCARVALAVLRSGIRAIPRAARRLPTSAFWRGKGYLVLPSHGRLLSYSALPAQIIGEMTSLHFRLLEVIPEEYPRNGHTYTSRWYYYAFARD